jgi:methyltransferase
VSILHVVLALVALQRLGELLLAQRNTARLRAEGAVESGRGHYPLLVGLHLAWLAALALLIPADTRPVWPLLGLFVAAQAARVWVIASLGRFWTTRIIALPGAPLVRRGPYRFIRHPNYLVVAVEIATTR